MKYLYLFLFCSLNCIAQQKPIEKIAAGCSTADLKKNLYYLASDKMKGRLMGSHEDTLASNYIVDCFKQNGLLAPYQSGKSYFQAITAYKQDDKATLTVNNTKHAALDGWEVFPSVPIKLSNLGVVYTTGVGKIIRVEF